MTRRNAVRRPRRLSVRFWKRGDEAHYIGHTTNISTTGMFLATNSPAPSGARIRIEVMERDRGFVVEGVVAHARKVRPELAKVSESGMGIRFLPVEDLVRELLPGAGGVHDETGELFVAPAPPWAEPAADGAAGPETHETLPPTVPLPPSAHTEMPPAAPVPPVAGSGTFAVRFATPAEFLEVYRRDILNGGLFVSTRFPARLQETVVVQLQPPLAGAEAIAIRARVVQRFEPQAGDQTPNLLSGMGLELIDLPALVEKMLPIVARMVER
jgi:hypothetical protein